MRKIGELKNKRNLALHSEVVRTLRCVADQDLRMVVGGSITEDAAACSGAHNCTRPR